VATVATFSVQISAKPFLGQGRIAGVCGRSTGDDRMGGIRRGLQDRGLSVRLTSIAAGRNAQIALKNSLDWGALR
jgi:hypothetical protein